MQRMPELTDVGRQAVATASARHGVSPDAAAEVLRALRAGGGTQAQFNHPDIGGMGQWSAGGMLMIGDMFNTALKARVDALVRDLASAIGEGGLFVEESLPDGNRDGWPSELGRPASTGAQNGVEYAVFPATRRLAVRRGGSITVYDTADHRIGGFSQQQSGARGTLTFSSQHGPVDLESLAVVGAADRQPTEAVSEPTSAPAAQQDDVFHKLERLHDLHRKGVLTEGEFQAKKAELLSRL